MEGLHINNPNEREVTEKPNIDDIKRRMEDLEKEYPKLFGPRPAAADAYSGLEKASTSEWINDEIEVVQEETGRLVLRNLSQIEEIGTRVQDFKLKVADYAFKLLELRETDNLTPGKESQILLGSIGGYKDQIDDLNKKIESYEIGLSAGEGYNEPDKNKWLLHAVKLLKPEYVYGKRMTMKDMLSELNNNYFRTGLDEKTRTALVDEYSNLEKMLVDMHFEEQDNS